MKRMPVLVALGVAVALTFAGCGNDTTQSPTTAATATSGAAPESEGSSGPPWPAPTDVPARVAAAGLDLGPMGTAEHYHPNLRVLINSIEVPVPPNIGVDPTTGAMSAVHTHEGDGTIHIEADTVGEVFTLGQVFRQWGVELTSTQIGGVKAQAGQEVTLTSNGKRVMGDPMDLRLEPEQQIVLELG